MRIQLFVTDVATKPPASPRLAGARADSRYTCHALALDGLALGPRQLGTWPSTAWHLATVALPSATNASCPRCPSCSWRNATRATRAAADLAQYIDPTTPPCWTGGRGQLS